MFNRYTYQHEEWRPVYDEMSGHQAMMNGELVTERHTEDRAARACPMSVLKEAGALSIRKFDDGSVLAIYAEGTDTHQIVLGNEDELESKVFVIQEDVKKTYILPKAQFSDIYTAL